jgi:hypothetical protein
MWSGLGVDVGNGKDVSYAETYVNI